MHFRWHDPSDVSEDFISAWHELSQSMEAPNLYLWPGFLMAAVRHLGSTPPARLAVVWNEDMSAMQALVPLVSAGPDRHFPYPHFSAFRSTHSFQTGLLARPGAEDAAFGVLFGNLLTGRIKGVRFPHFRTGTATERALHSTADTHGLGWIVADTYRRASLTSDQMSCWRSSLSRPRKKQIRRSLKRLNELGKVEARLLTGDEITDQVIEEFLALESSGWKAPTAMLGSRGELEFFREVCDQARAHGCLWLCEIRVGGRAIASTTNFVLGREAFAFKIGMDWDYRRYGPGILVEYALLDALERRGVTFAHFDSGAAPGSHLEDLWPGRTEMIDLYITRGRTPHAFFNVLQMLRRGKRKLRSLRSGSDPS